MADSQTTQTKLIDVRGLNIMSADYFPIKNIEEAMDYMPHDNDIILASYPKTGTHLTQYIVLQILSKGELLPSLKENHSKYFPYIEISGKDIVENMEHPRKYMHHLPYDFAKKNPKSKVLYVYRNPEDVFVSYFHFTRGIWTDEIDFDKYFLDFLSGRIMYGCYFKHVLSYMAHENDKNLLFLSYEELLSDKRNQILRIAKFLGEEYYQQLIGDEEILEKIIKHTSFQYMKKNLEFNMDMIQKSTKKVDLFRKGIVGEGKTSLSLGQITLLKEKAQKMMKGSRIFREWYQED